MNFLNPFMLLGAGAVAIPIIIHLLNQRRFRRVPWAAMRFLTISLERNQRRLKIEDIILLALRCALLLLLALTLARPAFRWMTSALGGSTVVAAIIVDQSGSMSARSGDNTRFDEARRAAHAVLDSLPAGSSTAVLAAADHPGEGITEPALDQSRVRRFLDGMLRSDRATDFLPGLSHAAEILRGRPAIQKEIYLITDGQAEGWRQFEALLKLMERIRTETRLHLIIVGENEKASPANLGVNRLHLVSGMPTIKETMRFEVEVGNYGPVAVRTVPVQLEIDGIPSERKVIETIAAGDSKTIILFAEFETKGQHRVAAKLPRDDVPFDDSRTIIIDAIDSAKVLMVTDEPDAGSRESATFFLRHALVPVSTEVAPDYVIEVKDEQANRLATSDLKNYDAVFLVDVEELPGAAVPALDTYVRDGGGLVFFPGERVKLQAYNRDFHSRRRMFPARLVQVEQASSEGEEEKYFSLQPSDYVHPLVALWRDPGSGTLASAQFYRRMILDATRKEGTTGTADSSRVVLRYNDGVPAVVEGNHGLGKVILFSSSADTTWNNLPTRPAFVPLMHRVLGRIVEHRHQNVNVRVGESLALRLAGDYFNRDAMVYALNSGGSTGTLERITGVDGVPVLHCRSINVGGAYEATVADPPNVYQFAAQADPDESRLDPLTQNQRDRLETVADYVTWTPDSSAEELQHLFRESRAGAEIWMLLLAGVVVLAITESILAQWFSRSR